MKLKYKERIHKEFHPYKMVPQILRIEYYLWTYKYWTKKVSVLVN